jgi:hypothetical protein
MSCVYSRGRDVACASGYGDRTDDGDVCSDTTSAQLEYDAVCMRCV